MVLVFMDESTVNLAKYRLNKSHKDLEAAKVLQNNQLFSQALNRSYYSIFHSVRALLSFEKFDSKKHSGIISYFNKYFIKAGKIEKEYSKILMSAERIRIDSDYDDFFITDKEQVKEQIKNAEKFYKRISNYLKENKNLSST